MLVKYINKNGDEITKEYSYDKSKYDTKKYSSDFYKLHKEQLLKTYICSCCNYPVKLNNKTNHNRTKKHLYFLGLNQEQ
jgi:hypothetical protein